MNHNLVLNKILFVEEEKIKADFTVEVKGGAIIHFPDVRVVSMSEDNKLLKVDSLNEKEKLFTRYFNMNYVVDFFFNFDKREDKGDNVN